MPRPTDMRHTRFPLVVLALAAWGCRPASEERGPRTGSPLPVAGKVEIDRETAGSIGETPFVLKDQTGTEFRSEALAGKVWMGAIFFANCPGPCFRENQSIADLLARIDHPDFLVLSLTCDPDNDTPDALRRYADRFGADPARWKFLTGDLEVIKKVGQETFKLPVELGVHSERGVVFDRQGRLRGGYHLLQEDRVKELEKLIRDVLAEEPDAE
jgi:cytochrome oxidase Cu insertion factor (SCO1/SenC/PrrC family)